MSDEPARGALRRQVEVDSHLSSVKERAAGRAGEERAL